MSLYCYCSSSNVSAEPFLNGSSSTYIEQMYEHWKSDPSSVHVSWDSYFRNVDAGMSPGSAFQRPGMSQPSVTVGGTTVDIKTVQDHLKVQALIRAYQVITDRTLPPLSPSLLTLSLSSSLSLPLSLSSPSLPPPPYPSVIYLTH